MPLWGFALSFICATLWAASPILVDRGLAVSRCTSNELNPIRSLSFLSLSLLIALILTHGHIALATSWRAYFYMVLSVTFSYMIGDILFFISIRKIGISIAVPVANAYPMLVTLTSWLLLGERLKTWTVAGIAVVVAGLYLLKTGGNKRKGGTPSGLTAKQFMQGFMLSVAAGFCWAFSSPLTKLAMIESGLGPVELTFYRSVIFFVLAWTYRIYQVRFMPRAITPLGKMPRSGWIDILSAGAVGLCFGSIIYAACIKVIPVAIVTAITATSPFMAALFARFVLKQYLYRLQWLGIVMIISGSVLVGM